MLAFNDVIIGPWKLSLHNLFDIDILFCYTPLTNFSFLFLISLYVYVYLFSIYTFPEAKGNIDLKCSESPLCLGPPISFSEKTQKFCVLSIINVNSSLIKFILFPRADLMTYCCSLATTSVEANQLLIQKKYNYCSPSFDESTIAQLSAYVSLISVC